MSRYVKFYPSIIKNIKRQMASSYLDDYETLNYILYRLTKKDNFVIEADVITSLRNIADFDVDDDIYCYLEKESDIVEAVKVRDIMFDILNSKMQSIRGKQVKFNTTKVRALLSNSKNNIIMKTSLYRIEFLTGMELKKYIVKTVVAPIGSLNTVKLLNKKETEDIIYKVARYLSVRFECGYKIDYEASNITVERGQVLQFHWDRGALLLNGKMIVNLLSGTKEIARKIMMEINNKAHKL